MRIFRKKSPPHLSHGSWTKASLGTVLALGILKLLTISETTAGPAADDRPRPDHKASSPEVRPPKAHEGHTGQPKESSQQLESQAGATPTRSDELRLCSFNVQRLGHNNGKDYDAVAHIIESYCDGVALLEVMRKGKDAPGFDAVLAELGNGWRGVRTSEPRPLPARGNSEYYAMVWRTARLRPCNGQGALDYVPDETGSRAKAGRFTREPAYGCFASASVGTKFDFLVALYHADYDQSSEVVQAEVRNIDSAINEVQRRCPAENDVFVLGDFNLTPKDLAAVTRHELLAADLGSTLSPTGERTAHQYDNALVLSRAATPELVGGAETLDPREQVGSPRSYRERVSDHLPLRITFKLTANDDDAGCPPPN